GAGNRIHGRQVGERDEVAASVRFLRQRGRDLREGVGTCERVVAVAEQTAAEPALDLDVDGDRVGERAFEKCRHRLDRGLETDGRGGDGGTVGEVEFHRACASRSAITPVGILAWTEAMSPVAYQRRLGARWWRRRGGARLCTSRPVPDAAAN